MKKLLLSFFILFCLQFAPAKAQWVTIPDANFVNWLNLNFPSCMNGNQMDTTCTDIVNINNVIVNDFLVVDLTGIQYFDSATTLWSLMSNNLANIPALPHALEALYIDGSLLTCT